MNRNNIMNLGIYNNGDRVEIKIDTNHWIQGTVQSFNYYTVRVDNMEIIKTQEKVRQETGEPLNGLYGVASRIQMHKTRTFIFASWDSWVYGIIVKLNYSILTITGEVVNCSDRSIRLFDQERHERLQFLEVMRQENEQRLRRLEKIQSPIITPNVEICEKQSAAAAA